jgi:hypothetical protein
MMKGEMFEKVLVEAMILLLSTTWCMVMLYGASVACANKEELLFSHHLAY